jgi:uncharacterized repeat protein (TIGR03943 family)
MNKQAQSVILLLVGGALLRASLTDLYLRYVKQGLRPFLIAAGVLLVASAVATLWFELKPRAADHDDADHDDAAAADDAGDDDGHGHGARGPLVAWLLILPVLGLLLVAPPALGSYSANRTGTALQQNTDDFAPLPAGDPVTVSVLDYASRAVFDEGKSLANRHVQISGFLMAAPDGSWYLTRMIISCCAADARPIKVGLTGPLPDNLSPDGWLRITGKYTDKTTKDAVNGERIPYIDVTNAQSIAVPTEQYES